MEALQSNLADPVHHPVEVIQQNSRRSAEQEQLQRQAINFGRAFALRTALAHKGIAATQNWSAGTRVAHVLRDQYDDRHAIIEFEDYLGRPQDQATMQPSARERMHKEMYGTDLVMKPHGQ